MVGMGLTAIIEFLAAKLVVTKLQFTQFYGSAAMLLEFLVFALLLIACLRAIKVRSDLIAILALCTFVFAALLPLTSLLTAEQRYYAFQMFKEVGDPGHSYFQGAVKSMLLGYEVSASVMARAWILSLGGVAALVYYLNFVLRRGLVKLLGINGVKATSALITAFLLHVAVGQLLLGRVYWLIVKAALEGSS
jgi:hypothetical protein